MVFKLRLSDPMVFYTGFRSGVFQLTVLCNLFIAYNGIILNTINEKMLKECVNQDIIDEFIRISPIAWAHVAFSGKYSFKKK